MTHPLAGYSMVVFSWGDASGGEGGADGGEAGGGRGVLRDKVCGRFLMGEIPL